MDNNVGIFYVRIPENVDIHKLDTLKKLLDEEENLRYEQYTSNRKIKFVTGRVLLKRTLASMLRLSPEEISFKKDMYGKPYLSNVDGQIGFNISYSKNIIVAAVVTDSIVGVNIKYRWGDYLAILPHICTIPEIEYINSKQNLSDRIDVFMQIWSRKQAAIKILGHGPEYSPLSFSVPYENGKVTDNETNLSYFTSIFLFDYILSVALPNQFNLDINESLKEISFNEISI